MRVLVVLLVGLSAVVMADDYRLSQVISPVSYDVDLSFPADIFKTEAANEYRGTVLLVFNVVQNTSEIQLHASAKYLNVKSVDSDNINVTGFAVNSTTDIFVVRVDSELTEGVTYSLTLSFVGNVSTSDMYGIYKSSYTEASGNKLYFITTQFEPTRARQAFPCLDEPSFKATFAFTFSYPTGLNVLYNTLSNNSSDANNVTTTSFTPSPKMSTYLVAFIISEFTCREGAKLEGNLINQVCSRSETDANRNWALQVTSPIVDAINAYTGVNYSKAMSKLDQVAITDFSAGAMENWGLITYRERALLYDDAETSNLYQQYIASVIAHELTHQWFGNLVTCNWWSEIFLNEGFATLLEYFITHEVLPDYQMDKQFVIKTVQSIFEEDASTSESLRSDASTPSQISERFGRITYDKGGSILRMAQNFMGSEKWKAGLNAYLNKYQYDSAVPDDLWDTIGNSTDLGFPWNLSTIMHNWVNYPGYPVLSVGLNGSSVVVSQKRFTFDSTSSDLNWFVPITYTTSANTSNFYDTTTSLWLLPNSTLELALPSSDVWIIFNNMQSSYYRVNYDETLWYRLSAALLAQNFSDIPDVNRAQIVNDAFNLARAGSLSYYQLFNITQFLANETSYIVWYPAFSGFDYLLKRVGTNSTLGAKIASHISELSTAVVASVPLTLTNQTDHIYTLSQVLAQSWACKLGNADCINTAVSLFQNYRETSVRPDKNLRSIVYCYGLKNSINSSRDWDFLWNAFLSTSLSTEQVTILAALGCSTDENVLTAYLNKTIKGESDIRSQDYAAVFAAVYQNSDVGVDVALDFFINNFELILERYTSMNAAGTLIKRIAELITQDTQLNKLKNFISSGALNGTILEAAKVAQSSAENNLAWVATYRNDLENYYLPSSSTDSTPSASNSTSTSTSTSTPPSSTPSTGWISAIPPSLLAIFAVIVLKFVVS